MSDTTVKTVFELSEPGRPGYAAPEIEVDATELPEDIIRAKMAATVFKNTKKAC